MSGRGTRRVLMIGLDAAEWSLVEAWARDGTLPCLGGLLDRGSRARLDPPDGILLGPPWPGFYTGRPVSEHGLYEYLVWRPDLMREVRASEAGLPLRPFWREPAMGGLRTVAIDVPLVPGPIPFEGVEVTCWGTHERLVPFATFPPSLARELVRSPGPPPMPGEAHHRVSLSRALRERDALCATSDGVAEIAVRLLEAEPWDLAIVCFSAPHRAGHKLWAPTGLDGPLDAEGEAAFVAALRDVYRSVDAAVGRVLDSPGADTTAIVFGLHGMGPNTSRALVLPDLLDRILAPPSVASGAGRGALGKIRARIPRRARDAIKRRLPVAVQDRLSTWWRTRGHPRDRRAFALAADLHGFVRLNLAGREAEGVVDPADSAALIDAIEEGLLGFRDGDTGEPVVASVVRRRELYAAGDRADFLPDLVVVWSDAPAAAHRRLVSDRHGALDWPTPGFNPDGRSGNHRLQGWVAAAGPGIPAGAEAGPGTLLDLAPTALALLGVPVPDTMRGRPLEAVTGPASTGPASTIPEPAMGSGANGGEAPKLPP